MEYLVEGLNNIQSENLVSFHVPGHKNSRLYKKLKMDNYINNLATIDTTEIPGTDNLHSPEDIIKNSLDRASRVFNSHQTYFLVNGSTCGIQAAIMSLCSEGDKILINRDCHKSAINACIMSGAEPIYLSPKIDKNLNVPEKIDLSEVEQILKIEKDIKAIFVTSPTYYGFCLDIKKLRQIAKDIPIIVDEAHGAHLGLDKNAPHPSLQAGADIVVQSTHKTLASFTQSSMMHIRDGRINKERLEQMLSMIQTSSPSYVLMSSLDMSTYIYETYGKTLMGELLMNVNELLEFVSNLDKIQIMKTDDITKIYIITKNLNITGYEIENILREKYKIQVEFSNHYGILLVSSIANEKDDFIKLKKALSEIDKLSGDFELNTIVYPDAPKKALSPKEAFYSKKETVDIMDSVNHVSAEFIIPYPPGVALISPGEIITEQIIDFILKSKDLGMNITGIKDTQLRSIQIIK